MEITELNISGKFKNPPPKTITHFEIKNMVMHYLPKGLNRQLPNLNQLTIKATGLKEIRRGDLEVFIVLRKLTISGNLIEELEKDLFIGNVHLERVILDKNRIRFIHPKVFIGQQLNYIFLDSNWCTDLKAIDKSQVETMFKKPIEDCMKDEYRLELGIEKLLRDGEIAQKQKEKLDKDIEEISKDVEDLNSTLNTLKDQRASIESVMKEINEQLDSLKELAGDSTINNIKNTLDLMASGFSSDMKDFDDTLKNLYHDLHPAFEEVKNLRKRDDGGLNQDSPVVKARSDGGDGINQNDLTKDAIADPTPKDTIESHETSQEPPKNDQQGFKTKEIKPENQDLTQENDSWTFTTFVEETYNSFTTLDKIYISICIAEFFLIVFLLFYCCCCKNYYQTRHTSETIEREESSRKSNICFDGDYQVFTLPHDRSRYKIDVIEDYGPIIDCIYPKEVDDDVDYDNILLENGVVDMEVPSEWIFNDF